MDAYFICGTDTEIGKTFTTCALLHAARASGRVAVGYKPVAAGVQITPEGLANADAVALQAAGSKGFTLAEINPICLHEAVAPHIAAAAQGVTLALAPLLAGFERLATRADLVLVEGVGGFRVPLTDTLDTADLAVALGLPLLLVVGMRLGCINHALLTVEAIQERGLVLTGWYANTLEPRMDRFDANLAALQKRINAPLLGVLPYCAGGPQQAACAVRLPQRV